MIPKYILDGRPRAKCGALLQVPLHLNSVHVSHDLYRECCNPTNMTPPADSDGDIVLPTRLPFPERWHRHPNLRLDGALPDDTCGLLRASQRHPSGSALAAVDLPFEVHREALPVNRGRL